MMKAISSISSTNSMNLFSARFIASWGVLSLEGVYSLTNSMTLTTSPLSDIGTAVTSYFFPSEPLSMTLTSLPVLNASAAGQPSHMLSRFLYMIWHGFPFTASISKPLFLSALFTHSILIFLSIIETPSGRLSRSVLKYSSCKRPPFLLVMADHYARHAL